jgi:hypothetical protein
LAQDVLRVDLSHHVFDVVHLHGLMNHHVPEDLHGDVVSLGQMVYGVKDGMGVHFYLPSLFSPSLSLILNFISTSILGK